MIHRVTHAIQTMMLALGVVGQPSAFATAFASSYSTDYDDYGNLIGGTLWDGDPNNDTRNVYLYAGEQYDPDSDTGMTLRWQGQL